MSYVQSRTCKRNLECTTSCRGIETNHVIIHRYSAETSLVSTRSDGALEGVDSEIEALNLGESFFSKGLEVREKNFSPFHSF